MLCCYSYGHYSTILTVPSPNKAVFSRLNDITKIGRYTFIGIFFLFSI